MVTAGRLFLDLSATDSGLPATVPVWLARRLSVVALSVLDRRAKGYCMLYFAPRRGTASGKAAL